MMAVNRRLFLFTCAAASLGPPSLEQATAQTAIQPLVIEDLLRRLARPEAINQTAADIYYIHSWRAEIAPKGYEGNDGWLQAANSFAGGVFRQASSNSVATIQNSSARVLQADKQGLQSYSDPGNRDGFDDFLEQLGIDPAGRAGQRILTSLRDFLALAAANPDSNLDIARNRSFFWPFC